MAPTKKVNRRKAVSGDLLLWLAGELTSEWQDLGRKLGLPEGKLYDIRRDNCGDEKEAKYQMLVFWKQTNGQAANLKNLAEALKNIKRYDLSEKVQHGKQ